MKKALITGVTGQDGSYLAELLVAKGYAVYGIIRRSSSFNTGRIDHIYQDQHDPNPHLRLVYGDLNDASSLNRIIRDVAPDEIYNLGAQSHVRVSFDIPEYTGEVTALGAVRLLEAIREARIQTKFYQASSSEMFGNAPAPQNENTPLLPRSPYATAKVYAHWMTAHTGTVTACSHATGFSSIMSLHDAVRPLLHARSPRPPRVFMPAVSRNYFSEISMRAVTGALPVITWKPCG